MCKKVILAGLAGGIVYFIWSAISWMALPFHGSTLHNFKNEQAVTQVLSQNTEGSGIYVLPGCPKAENAVAAAEDESTNSTSKETTKKAVKKEGKNLDRNSPEWQKRFTDGPLAFVSYSKIGGDPTMKKPLILWFITQTIGALLIGTLLACVGCCCSGCEKSTKFGCRVLFVTIIGVLIGFLGNMPGVVWWNHSLHFMLVNFFDDVIGWTLAGFVMAWIIPDPKTCVRK